MRRTMDIHELVFVRRGTLPVRVGGDKLRMGAGQAALWPAGVEHAGIEAITEPLEFYWLHFFMPSGGDDASNDGRPAPQPLPPSAQPLRDERILLLPSCATLPDPDRVVVLFGQLLDQYVTHGPHANPYCDFAATTLLLEISDQERRRLAAAANPGAPESARPQGLAAMRNVRAWIAANAFDDITVAAVARRFHYSPSYLTALYRRVFDIGVTEQITECRIDRARDLLSSTTTPIAQIAREVGYDDPKYFMRVFKRRTGLTPGQYRATFPSTPFNTL